MRLPSSRRRCLVLSLLMSGILPILATSADASEAAEAPDSSPKTLRVYVGTYTNDAKSPSEGIYLLDLDLATGKLSPVSAGPLLMHPSFLAIHPNRKFLYSVNEVDSVNGKKGGGVSALSIDPATGKLALLNAESSVGNGPCHLVVDKQGKNVLVANYGGGSVACLPINPDGTLAPASAFIQHHGGSVDKGRQTSPHAHSINLDPAGRFAFVPDLGLDKIMIYRFDSEKGTLTPNTPDHASVAPGSGPRHFTFHPSGKFAYVITEMGNTITAFDYDAEHGSLKEIQAISTLPDDFDGKGKSFTAEVLVHPSGKFVYGSNRGHNSIAVFAVDEATGKLTARGHHPTLGKFPRNFAIDPTGAYLLAENQESDTIVVFRIDQTTGALTQVGDPYPLPKPVCIRFLPKPE